MLTRCSPSSVPDVLDEATEELLDAIAFYETRRPGLGLRFRGLVALAFDNIDALPKAWSPYDAPGAPEGTRHIPLKPFQESVIFVVDPEPLVVAISHARRRPGYWARRLESDP